MIGKKEIARVASTHQGTLQVYYRASFWNAECIGGFRLTVNDTVEVIGGEQLPLQVMPLLAVA